MEEYRGSRKGRRFRGHSSIEPTSTGLLIHGSTGSLLLSSFSLFFASSSPVLTLLFFFFFFCCCGSVASSFVLFEVAMLVLGAARCQIPSAAAACLVGRRFKGGNEQVRAHWRLRGVGFKLLIVKFLKGKIECRAADLATEVEPGPDWRYMEPGPGRPIFL